MDSLTQVALGGAVGYAVLGSKVGRKAIIWGAILGTLPDLDVLLPYAGEVESFTYHRGFSHSLLVHLLASPVIVWLILKLHTTTQQYKKHWFWLVFLCLSTHAALDSFTVYGTQLMWPFTEHPFGVSNLFIIDPFYTFPLLFCLAIAALPKISVPNATRINIIGLVVSSAYICWSLVAKVYIDQKVDMALEQRGIVPTAFLSSPAPLSTLLWRIVVMTENEYYEGYASIFDDPADISLTAYTTQPELLNEISDEWRVQRLQWFTKGFYAIKRQQADVILSDLRMGAECNYVFSFVVGEITQSGVQVGSFEKRTERPDLSKVGSVWDRISDPRVSLAPMMVDNECKKNLP
ncbi:MAG: inner membrane protein [Glaciecola sp.]|jgi:inner membrane protein